MNIVGVTPVTPGGALNHSQMFSEFGIVELRPCDSPFMSSGATLAPALGPAEFDPVGVSSSSLCSCCP